MRVGKFIGEFIGGCLGVVFQVGIGEFIGGCLVLYTVVAGVLAGALFGTLSLAASSEGRLQRPYLMVSVLLLLTAIGAYQRWTPTPAQLARADYLVWWIHDRDRKWLGGRPVRYGEPVWRECKVRSKSELFAYISRYWLVATGVVAALWALGFLAPDPRTIPVLSPIVIGLDWFLANSDGEGRFGVAFRVLWACTSAAFAGYHGMGFLYWKWMKREDVGPRTGGERGP